MSLGDPIVVERILTAAGLGALAVAVAFGPELGRVFSRMRNREIDSVAGPLPVETPPS